MNISEVVFCLLILLPIIPMILFKQFRLMWVFVTFYLCFGLQEWLSVIQTGHSISQLFWAFNSAHPIQGWIIVISMGMMWAALLVHFKSKEK